MSKLIKESEYFVTWLLMWLGGTIGGAIIGAFAGGLMGDLLHKAGTNLKVIQVVCSVLGYLLGSVLSYLLFRLIVGLMIVKKTERRIRGGIEDAKRKAEESDQLKSKTNWGMPSTK